MRILILGSGLMGPAAAFNAMSDPDVAQVVLADLDPRRLDATLRKLARLRGAEKLAAVRLDLNDQAAAAGRLADFDVVVAALPHSASLLAIRAALTAGVPLVDLTRFDGDQVDALRQEAQAAGGFVILGCGLEPGLTEIMARHLAEKLDRVDELHIQCGGIPEKPAPPLGYKIVFGGCELPLHEMDALVVADGRLEPVPRYSGVEETLFPGVGMCEAWHEGFLPWILELPSLKTLRVGTQKTVRWQGYAHKVTVLKEMGLLSQKPVTVDGVSVAPKKLLDAVLAPRVRLEEGEGDIAVLRVEVIGEKRGRPRCYRIEMVDRYDPALNFTAMARTTAFTATIVARMIARGDLRDSGARTPEQVLTGPLFDRLVSELAVVNIRFDLTTERVESLEGQSAD